MLRQRQHQAAHRRRVLPNMLVVGAEQCHHPAAAVDDGLGRDDGTVRRGAARGATRRLGGRQASARDRRRADRIAGRDRGPGLWRDPVCVLSDPVASRRADGAGSWARTPCSIPRQPRFRTRWRALTGDGFDVVFEASGARPALRQAFEVVRRGGTVGADRRVLRRRNSAARQPTPDRVNSSSSDRSATATSSTKRSAWWPAGRVNLRPLISRVFPLREANAALALACAKNDVVKVQIDLT